MLRCPKSSAWSSHRHMPKMLFSASWNLSQLNVFGKAKTHSKQLNGITKPFCCFGGLVALFTVVLRWPMMRIKPAINQRFEAFDLKHNRSFTRNSIHFLRDQ